jgi:hypothetical protein
MSNLQQVTGGRGGDHVRETFKAIAIHWAGLLCENENRYQIRRVLIDSATHKHCECSQRRERCGIAHVQHQGFVANLVDAAKRFGKTPKHAPPKLMMTLREQCHNPPRTHSRAVYTTSQTYARFGKSLIIMKDFA